MKACRNSSIISRRGRGTVGFGRLLAITSIFGTIVGLMLSPIVNVITGAAAMGVAQSVIIQLQDDPAAVWQAKQKKAGKTVTDADIASYRSTLKTKQDQFLAALTANGINYQVSGIDEPNFDGTIAGPLNTLPDTAIPSFLLSLKPQTI